MKLRFNREEMADALALVAQVTAVRTPKEILKCVRLEARPDVLLLAATDLEIGLRYAVTQIEVEKPGEVVVLADTLHRIVRECADEVLSLDLRDSVLHLRGAGSHFKIVTQAVTDFVPVPGLDEEPDLTVDLVLLRRMIEWTLFAAARESTRYAINGVLWETTGERLLLAATDGRRLSLAKGKVKVPKGRTIPHAIVPVKALSLLGRMNAEPDSVALAKITANQLRLKVGGVVISTSLLEGHFPKYQDVIPSDSTRRVDLNTVDFHSALKRASLLTNEESKGVRLAFSDGSLTLSSRAPEQGEADITIPADYRGESIDIGFNPVFLMDVVRVAHEDVIRFEFSEPNRPGVMKVGDDFIHVVMPVNLTSA